MDMLYSNSYLLYFLIIFKHIMLLYLQLAGICVTLAGLQPVCSESGVSVLELLTENSLSGKSVLNRDVVNSHGDVLANLLSFPFLLL